MTPGPYRVETEPTARAGFIQASFLRIHPLSGIPLLFGHGPSCSTIKKRSSKES